MSDYDHTIALLSAAEKRAILGMTADWQRPGKATFNATAAANLRWCFPGLVDSARVGRTQERAHTEYRLLPRGVHIQSLLPGCQK